jgi:hypothetical protein
MSRENLLRQLAKARTCPGEQVAIHVGTGDDGVVTVVEDGCDPSDPATHQHRLVCLPQQD